jgi:hypothetical protein
VDRIDGGDGHVVAQRRLEDVGDRGRQARLGHLLGLLGERAQGPRDRAGHQPGDEAGDGQGQHAEQDVAQPVGVDLVVQPVGLLVDLVVDRRAEAVVALVVLAGQ